MNLIHTFVEERRLKGNAFISYYNYRLVIYGFVIYLLEIRSFYMCDTGKTSLYVSELHISNSVSH